MNDKTKATTTNAAALAAASAAAVEPVPPRLGATIVVQAAPGRDLTNNETGLPFVPGEDTPVTVTVTTLRRLADGDLMAV